MKVTVTVIPIEIGGLGTVTKGLIQGLENLEIRGRFETIQTTALLRSVAGAIRTSAPQIIFCCYSCE